MIASLLISFSRPRVSLSLFHSLSLSLSLSLSSSAVFHKEHPLLCQWFISLARLPAFSSAQWKDSGSAAHLQFILAKSSHNPTEKSSESSQTGPQPVQGTTAAKGGSKSSAQKRGSSKGKGQSAKGQQKKTEPRSSQQSVSGL